MTSRRRWTRCPLRPLADLRRRAGDLALALGDLALARGALLERPPRVQLGELELQVARRLARLRRAPAPVARGVELPRALVIGKRAFQRVEQLGLKLGGLDRRGQLDAVVEVARHQVG